MPDIALRFHRDMLVLSAPSRAVLMRQGVDSERDMEFMNLVEPEMVRDAMRLEKLAGAQCLVANTAGLTPARLSHGGMDGRSREIAKAALGIVNEFVPQHVLVELGPCGLPLDASSGNSLNENRDQYARAARACGGLAFDAVFLDGFTNPTDLKCALMGVRQVLDVPVFASVDVAGTGMLPNGHSLEEALAVMVEFGASVVGFATGAEVAEATKLARRATGAVDAPLLAQLRIAVHDLRQGGATPENPYYCPDTMVDAAMSLRAAGVQFLRATGSATPAYTGALAVTTDGLDVVRAPVGR